MFIINIKTAIRNLKQSVILSFINICGLSIGLTCSVLILIYTSDELSYDRFHKNCDNIYQLTCDRIERDGVSEKFAIAAMVQGPAFTRAIPEIQEFVRVKNQQLVIKKGSQIFAENITWVDAAFFSVFSFPLLSGTPKEVLLSPHSMVLTEEIAEKYFGSTDVIGRTLQIEMNGQFESFQVSGIAKKAPDNSSIKYGMLLPFKYLEQLNPDNGWMWVSYPTYFVMRPEVDIKIVQQKMSAVYEVQAKAEVEMNRQAGYNTIFKWGLSPLKEMHLKKDYQGVPEASDPVYSYILSGITFFILLIACINFVNLSIAQSIKKNKEILIRKINGATRPQLIWQFLTESLIFCVIAFSLAIFLVQILLPLFNELANKKLSIFYLSDLRLIAGILILFIVTVFSAGLYPALKLSGLQPVAGLQSRTRYSHKNNLAKGLVVIQFAIATFLIIATIFMYRQLSYVKKTDLGYNDKNIVEVVVDKAVMNKSLMNILKKSFATVAGVDAVAYRNIGKFGGKTQAGGKEFAAVYEHIDEDYLSTLQIPVLAGRNFSGNFLSDSISSVLVNETFAREAGWNSPVGKTVDFLNLPGWGEKKITVIGLVKDYHFESLKEKIRPQLFTMEPQLPLGKFIIKISSTNVPATLQKLEATYHAFISDHPFQYSFADDLIQRNYAPELKWKQIISFAALVTIFISCTGLFGLTLLSTETRFREIGIRKVLGASTSQIVRLISFDFLALVFIAFLIAIPAGGYAVSKWLQNFAYRIDVSWWLFTLAGLLSLLIAILTICFHTIRAALTNPVHTLRTD